VRTRELKPTTGSIV